MDNSSSEPRKFASRIIARYKVMIEVMTAVGISGLYRRRFMAVRQLRENVGVEQETNMPVGV